MKTVCEKDLCNGCMACVDICPKEAVRVDQKPEAFNSIIDEEKCIGCNACTRICPRNEKSFDFHKPKTWYQGWSSSEIRSGSASGGAATAIIKGFIESGGYVCSCVFADGEFRYKITNSREETNQFAGSKYVKSNPEGVYRNISDLLSKGKAVLFIGLPCHVAALKKYVNLRIQYRLYTVDLICHGTPAPILLKKYLSDHGIDIQKIESISFRTKNDFRVRENTQPIVPLGIADRYLYSFLKKVNYTTNCYMCQFASLNRIADLTLGDSWGTELAESEQKKGISLLLSQNEKGNELIKLANLTTLPVDLMKAVENNAQLQNSSKEPKERKKFFKLLETGINYDRIMFKIFPRVFIKQDIKMVLMKLHIISSAR